MANPRGINQYTKGGGKRMKEQQSRKSRPGGKSIRALFGDRPSHRGAWKLPTKAPAR